MLKTVGHSTHSLEEFVGLLRAAGITHIVDVRTLPGSTKFSHFNEEELQISLPANDIKYSRIAALGGLRKKTPGIDAQTNAMWRNASFHRYADYALSSDFKDGLEKLLTIAQNDIVAVMCAEAVWWRCHRRIIADYAIAWGHDVQHLMPSGKLMQASLTPGAVVNGKNVEYPIEEEK